MRVIRIDEGKKEKLSEHTEKILKHAGKLMQCLEDLEEGGYGERDDDDDDDDMGMRGSYRGGGYGMRDYDGYGMRRSRRTGRYMR